MLVISSMEPSSSANSSQTAGGRGLLGNMYHQITGNVMPDILITPKGKPYFANGPLHFSITHTKYRAFCSLSDTPVGIDAEPTGRVLSSGVRERCFTTAEKEWAEGQKDYLKLWTLKEAYVKYTGTGLNWSIQELDFSIAGERGYLKGSSLSFYVFARDGHVLAVCSESNELPQYITIASDATR